MNWSAKFTAISFLAVVAFGAAPFMGGCKADSSTSNDTTGDDDDDDDVVGDDDDDTTSDAGDDATGGGTCEVPKQTKDFEPASLQTCLESNCCDKLKTCFDITPEDDSKVGCDDFAECMATCDEQYTDEGERETCYNDICVATAADGVVDAYNGIISCATDNSCQ